MVFRYKTSRHVMFEEHKDELREHRSRNLHRASQEATNKMQHFKEHRDATLKSLANCGLQLFCFYSRDRDEVFCKIGASATKLRDVAARMRYKLQLKPEYAGAYAEYRHDFPGRPAVGFTDRRIVSHLYKIHTDDEFHSEDAIFSTRDKIVLIDHIINSKDKDCAGLAVGDLLHERELRGFFPLHENHVLQDLASRIHDWVVMPKEHANRVRDYFGEKVTFYFLFMSFYWKWLVIPALVGVILQLIDVICRTPDNWTATPFCIVSTVSALLLPHFWRREEAKYALAWGTYDLDDELEPPRPEYWGEPRINPVTAQVEPFYPDHKRKLHYCLSFFVMIICAIFLTASILGVLYARHQLKEQVPGGIITFQIALAFLVEAFNVLLTAVCRCLTDRENHRAQSEYDLHLLWKVMGFKFASSYFVLYYIAFLKDHTVLFGSPMRCIRNDCFLDLQAQLAVFTVVNLAVKNLARSVSPRLRTWWRHVRVSGRACMENMWHHDKLELAELSSAEIQSKMETFDGFADFDETLITHGYASFFAVSSPWVCAATLLWVICELLLDMKGLTETRKRPFPLRVRGTGPWASAFEAYGVIAAFTNIALLVFVSDQYGSWTPAQKVILFIFFGHVIFLSCIAVKIVLPAIPRSVELTKMKQEIVVQRALENITVQHHQQDISQLRMRDGNHRVHQVLEHDPGEDEEPEPQLSAKHSWLSMSQGLKEHVPWRLLICIVICLVVVAVTATCLFFFLGFRGHARG